MYEALINSVPMLKTLQNYERLNLADALIPKSFAAGDRIIKQGMYERTLAMMTSIDRFPWRLCLGDAADGMYFIEEGTVSIKILQDRGETEISKLEKGQYFGELALVTHRPRAASAYAQDHVKVACKLRPPPMAPIDDESLIIIYLSRYSYWCRGIRASSRSVHGSNEAKHWGLRVAVSENIWQQSKHGRYPISARTARS